MACPQPVTARRCRVLRPCHHGTSP